MDRGLIGSGMVITPPLIGPFCVPAGVQSTAQSWRTDPLTYITDELNWTFKKNKIVVGLRIKPFSPDHSETFCRASLLMEVQWESPQGWPIVTSSACLRKNANDTEQKSEVRRVKKNSTLKNATVIWKLARYLVTCLYALAVATLQFINCAPAWQVCTTLQKYTNRDCVWDKWEQIWQANFDNVTKA